VNSEVENALAAELATLTRVVDPPTGDLGYGTDLSCTTDLDPQLAEVDPQSPQAIVEAVIRRYTTPRGSLPDDEDGNYGLDVRAHCNRGMTQVDLRALAGALQGEAQKDDRVLKANVSITADARARTLELSVRIIPADLRTRAFGFTFAVTSAEVLKVTING
jgi:hypothetical protein